MPAYRGLRFQRALLSRPAGGIPLYGSGTARVMRSTGGVEREADLEDVYYAPEVHVRLLSFGKLEGQGGTCA